MYLRCMVDMEADNIAAIITLYYTLYYVNTLFNIYVFQIN